MKTLRFSLLASLLLLAASHPAGAYTQFTTTGTGDWFNPANWTGDGVPTTDEQTIIVPTTGTAVIASGTAVAGYPTNDY